jgi:hypothetical protein
VQSDITEKLRLWFLQCPAFTDKKFSVDYLGEKGTQYAIYMTASAVSSGIDVLGNPFLNSRQKVNFALASAATYGQEVLQNLYNLGFFDEITKWMWEQNKTFNFPNIAEGKVISILPVSTQALIEAGANVGQYQIQCKLTYFRD